jgi:hypothetical protein
LTEEEVKSVNVCVKSFDLYFKDEEFILEVLNKFIMCHFESIDIIIDFIKKFISFVSSYVKTNLKLKCKSENKSPMRETFLLVCQNNYNSIIDYHKEFGIRLGTLVNKLYEEMLKENAES